MSERKVRKYSEAIYKSAVHAVRSGLLTCGKAAKVYGVPKTTLYMHRKEVDPAFAHIGRSKVLSDEEKESLANYMRWCEEHAIPFSYQLLKSFAHEIIKEVGKEAKVCPKWCYLFAKRHGFSSRKPRHQEPSRAVAGSSPSVIIEYHTLLQKEIERLGLQNKPQNVWNADEKGWSKQQALQQPVLVTRGKPQATTRQIFTNEHITTLHATNADGEVLEKTYVIFCKNIPSLIEARDLPLKWDYGTTESGYINKELFFKWFSNMFIPSIGKDRPQVLTYDAASCHISLELVRLARQENISIIQLPGKTTAFLQPMDQIFSQLSSKFSEIAYSLCFTKFDFLVRPKNFPQVLSQAVQRAWQKHIIVNAFEITGMFPPSLEMICKSPHITTKCREELQNFINTGALPEEVAIEMEEMVDDNVVLEALDELCDDCGNPPCNTCITNAKKRTNVLFKGGLITENLIRILDPPDIPKPKGRSRITKAKHITGEEILKDLQDRHDKEQEKEQEKARKANRSKAQEETADIQDNFECDDGLPTINPPRRSRKRKQTNYPTENTDSTDESPDTVEDPTVTAETEQPGSSDSASKKRRSAPAADVRRSSRNVSKNIDYATLNETGVEEGSLGRAGSSIPVSCPQCHVPYAVGEDVLNIHWYGCDICERWWHRDCLPAEFQAVADHSCMDETVVFRCPSCPILKLCVVCFVEGTDNFFCQCDNCLSFYHFDCIPEQHYIEYKTYKENNRKWFCSRCEIDE